MAVLANDYPYRLLKSDTNEIRLLTLSYSPRDGSCSLSLTHASLDAHPRPVYSALSYVWGDPSDTSTILIDSFLVSITKNLSSALTRLQAQHVEGNIWIDALCINQPNTAEKNPQVALMGRIYREAEVVWIWLGPEPDDGALKTIQELGSSFRTLLDSPKRDENRIKSHLQTFLDTEETELECVWPFFRRPWWWRVWVIQEVVLARQARFLCGHDRQLIVPWEDIKACLHLFNSLETVMSGSTEGRHRRLFRHAFHTAVGCYHLTLISDKYNTSVQEENPGICLCEALYSTSYAAMTYAGGILATDPRDKIYGLLGMAREVDRRRVPLDYSPHMTLEKLIIVVSEMFLSDYGPEMLLRCRRTRESSSSPKLPSWVFNPTADTGTMGIIERIGNADELYHPSKGTSWQDWASRCDFRSASDGSPVVSMAGILVGDRVRSLGQVFAHPKIEPGFQGECRKFLLELRDMVDGVGNGDYLENIWRVPIARTYHRDQAGAMAEDDGTLLHGFDVLMENEVVIPAESDDAAEKAAWAATESWKYTGNWRAHQLRAFIDDVGRPGLGPIHTEIGDQIVIFAGGYAPFILREVNIGDESFYRLIGSTYVYGLMEGEAMEGGGSFEDIPLI